MNHLFYSSSWQMNPISTRYFWPMLPKCTTVILKLVPMMSLLQKEIEFSKHTPMFPFRLQGSIFSTRTWCGVPLEHFWRLRAVRIIEEESAASGVCLYMCTSVCTSVCRRCVARPVILPCGPVVGTHANLRTHAFSHPQIYGHTGVGMWLFAGSALFVHYWFRIKTIIMLNLCY
jgi:hypothetical protein